MLFLGLRNYPIPRYDTRDYYNMDTNFFPQSYGFFSAVCYTGSMINIFKEEFILSSIWPQLFLQVILIAINAYFAATEIAVISLNEALIRKQAEGGDRKAAKLLRIVEMPTRFLSTIQIGITLAGFLGSAFAAGNLAGPLTQWAVSTFALTGPVVATVHTLSVIVVTVILSFFTLVFGELVPKRVAMKKSEAVARFSCGVVSLLATVMRPLIWLLTISTNAVLWLFRINPNDEDKEVSEEGLRILIDLSEEKGAIETEEKEMIENIFEFNNMTAADVMVHRTDMVMLKRPLRTPACPASPSMRRTPTTSSASSPPGSGSSTPASLSPSPCGSCSVRPTLCPSRYAPTCCSGICRAKRSTCPLWWTSTAAPPDWSPWRTCWRRS